MCSTYFFVEKSFFREVVEFEKGKFDSQQHLIEEAPIFFSLMVSSVVVSNDQEFSLMGVLLLGALFAFIYLITVLCLAAILSTSLYFYGYSYRVTCLQSISHICAPNLLSFDRESLTSFVNHRPDTVFLREKGRLKTKKILLEEIVLVTESHCAVRL
jgi:hypothetical protein